nr:hypothetical protein [Tanacetum cinerariifolium]
SNSSKTPKAVIHHEFINTPDGSVYWVPRVSTSVLPVMGNVYDSLDECIEIYRKYASEAGFGIRLSCQKRLKCGYVKQKYILCNREGYPKDVWLNTLDPKKNVKQERSSNIKVCGCKARVVFDMVVDTTKYILTTFDVEHIHELDRDEYKHLSKAERKYKMVFVPFMAIDNYRRSVSVGSGLLKKEAAETYGWLLRAFKKAFVHIGKLGDIGFFIGYSADSCAYRIYNRRIKKIMETMNVSFDELSAMAFKQCSSKLGLQTMYDDYFSVQPSVTVENVPPAQEP